MTKSFKINYTKRSSYFMVGKCNKKKFFEVVFQSKNVTPFPPRKIYIFLNSCHPFIINHIIGVLPAACAFKLKKMGLLEVTLCHRGLAMTDKDLCCCLAKYQDPVKWMRTPYMCSSQTSSSHCIYIYCVSDDCSSHLFIKVFLLTFQCF